ncbi:tetratricopeptide repeat protein [Nocardia sp. CA-129566]|uniref:tetratricopeptide repeat protein n=1 Tax=Nocardia sp. CA-129566 TaxID=3239976 RepID=UPI003D975942
MLTSAHVVDAYGAVAMVFRPGRAGQFVGHVVWRGTPGGRDDAALVEIDDPEWTPVEGAARRGTSVTHRPGLPCECWGVPNVTQRAGHPMDTAQLTGKLNPGDGMVGDRFLIRLEGHPPATGRDGHSPWGGLSGAAVFSGKLLIGVVAADPAAFEHSALEVVPSYVLHHDSQFRAVLDSYGPATVIEAAELAGLATEETGLHVQAADVSPAALLTARRAVVGFRGRNELLKDLRKWAEQPGLGMWLVHGPGGQGKTRLARHFGEKFAHLGAQGQFVLWLNHEAKDLTVIADTVVPVLVVVDYAESRPSQLAALLTALAATPRSPSVKVLVLARTAGDWWNQLADASDAVTILLNAATVTELPVLDAADIDRRDGYRAAVAAFADELARLPGHADTDWPARAQALADRPLPSTTAAWTVLAIQMTALADLLDDTAEPIVPQDNPLEVAAGGRGAGHGESPEERVLRHERRYWKNTAEAAKIFPDLGMGTLTDAIAATVLLPPPAPTLANDWLARIPGLSDRDRRRRVREWLAGLYPAASPYAFGQLEPDRLAEHLIGTLIADHPATSIAETLAADVDGEDATRWVSVCARAAAHPGLGDPVGEMLARMFKKHPTTVAVAALEVAPGLEVPKPLVHGLKYFVHDPATPTASLASVADALPKSSLLWAETAAELFDVLNARCQPEEPDVDAVRKLDILGVDRTQFINETIGITNKVAESHGLRAEWSRPDVASNLARRALWLADLGRREEALAASTEAVEIFRRLAKGEDADSLPSRDPSLYNLAMSLGNHSNLLEAVGRWEDALAAISESLQIFKRLANARPDAYLSNVAGSLSNYAAILGDLGRREDALTASAQAIQIYRRLVNGKAGQDALLHNFVMTLGNHSMQLLNLDRLGRRQGALGQDALAATTEVVQILRQRAEERPDAFLPDLAISLGSLSSQLEALGRREDALAATIEVVEIYRQLAEARPDAFLSELAGNLNNLVFPLLVLDRSAEALDAVTEAVTIRRRLARTRPERFRREFAGSLNDLAVVLEVLGRLEDALAAITEAVIIRRELVKTRPDVHRAELDQSLRILSRLQGNRDT